jgi:hypothetical protein
VRVLLAADPKATTHHAFRLARSGHEVADSSSTMDTLNKQDGFEMTEADQQIRAAYAHQLAGHFLIDRDGILRWGQTEAGERIGDLTKFPSDEEILRAARAL